MTSIVTVVGLGPAGPELITAETSALLAGPDPVWLRTERHPAAGGLTVAGTFDHLYDEHASFPEVYRAIVEHLVAEAVERGHVVYAVPGSPVVAERTVELLRADERITLDVRAAMSFADLAWIALGIDPMAEAATIVDAHRFVIDAAGRLGPFLVTQVHSADVLDDVILALDELDPPDVTILKGLGTPVADVRAVPWGDLRDATDPDHLTSLWIPRLAAPVAGAFARFDELVRRLRAECPWDREQTHGSLRRYLLEEAYEVLEAIDMVEAGDDGGPIELEEELGDLLFQIFFHSRLASEQGWFTVADVADGIHDKLFERHPHVFGDADPDHIMDNWEQAKQVEKKRKSVMDGIPSALPALLHALKTQKRAATVGFSGPDLDWALADVAEELAEVTAEPNKHEVGDLLYAGVQVARMLDVDPETALRQASNRFADRFRHVEAGAQADGVDLADLDMTELRARWTTAKGV
ncbi:MAG: nucleoside triphosphate pyrophosphohydrolase [Acidimicrobiales bacterium]